MSIFSDRLSALRKRRGLTQQQIADELSINRVTYTNWEKGNREPSFTNLIKLTAILGTTSDYLLGNSDKNIDMHNFKNELDTLTEEEIIDIGTSNIRDTKMSLVIATKETGYSLDQLVELLAKTDKQKEWLNTIVQDLKKELKEISSKVQTGNNSETTETK
ncbi:helix-turn-helix domain-containing protein [Streptococcus sp. DD12]|uniref:helix-turn-helix domain-containing protein n=1 Tax=Streptococcus sp. DD12 TaxID=1777880 RepID=UPI0009E8B02D|nr:helix-turn-helix transcriptional regulator [Streptococcus sp. DD12]